MAEYEIERYLQPLEIVNYFHEKQRSNNHDLIKHFRPLLVESSLAKENHEFLKKVTAKLVIIKKIQGQKMLELKPEFKDRQPWEILQDIEEGHKEANSKKARSRAPIYEPTSLENEKDYFVTPKDVSDSVEEKPEVIEEQQQSNVKLKKKRISSKRKKSSAKKALMTIDEDIDEVFEEPTKEVSCQKCLG